MAKPILKSKPPLLQRPSTLFFSHNQQSKNDELLLEKRIVNSNFKLRFVFHGFEDCKQCLWNRKYHNITSFDEINKKLTEKIVNVFAIQNDEERIVLGNKLARIGIVEVLANFYKTMQDGAGIHALTDTFMRENTDDECVQCLLIIRRILWDYSDCSPNFALALSKTDFVSSLLDDIVCFCDEGVTYLDEQINSGDDMFVFCSAICIICNLGKHPYAERDGFRRDGIIYQLKSFMNSKYSYIQMMSLLALAYVVKEDQTYVLDANFDVFDFLIARINDAVLSKDRRENGYHIAELVDGLTGLIQGNKCKQRFMNKRPLPLIKSLLIAPNLLENLSAIKLIWELAFLEGNRKILRNDEELMTIFQEMKLNHDPDIRNAAQKTRFVINWKESFYKDVSHPDENTEEHILLSYNWADRTEVYEIYRVLKSEGFPVWIDIAEMNKYTDILDGVTRAVRQSKLVLVCYSEKYKRDQNCRTEAEYAYELRRPIIPVKLQTGYEPDGWLRALLGPKFYLDFTKNSTFERQINKLRDCINIYNKLNGISIWAESFGNYIMIIVSILLLGTVVTVTVVYEYSRRRTGITRRYESNVGGMNQLGPGSPRSSISRNASRATSRISSRPVSRLPSRGPSRCPIYKKLQDWTTDDVIQWTTHYKLQGRAWRVVSRFTVPQILHVYNKWKKSPETFYEWTETMMQLGSVEDLIRFRNAIKSLTGFV